MKSYIAGKNETDLRLSRFVESVTTNFPASMMYKSFRNKRIKINGKKADADYRICNGDVIELYINDEFFIAKPSQQKPLTKAVSKPVKINVLFEDENIAVLYKPAHLLCHADKTGDINLADNFVEYLTQKGEFVKSEENTFTPALCNRLDRGTEGIIIAGKSYAALRDLNEIIKNDLVDKTYHCIGVGSIKKGRYVAFLRHFEKDNKVDIKDFEQNGYKKIITQITPINNKGPYTLFEIGLITGRTHQIRAHLSFLGAPILGDIKYGNKKMNDRCKAKTQALSAVKIVFKKIPDESTLSYLSGMSVELPHHNILEQFDKL